MLKTGVSCLPILTNRECPEQRGALSHIHTARMSSHIFPDARSFATFYSHVRQTKDMSEREITNATQQALEHAASDEHAVLTERLENLRGVAERTQQLRKLLLSRTKGESAVMCLRTAWGAYSIQLESGADQAKQRGGGGGGCCCCCFSGRTGDSVLSGRFITQGSDESVQISEPFCFHRSRLPLVQAVLLVSRARDYLASVQLTDPEQFAAMRRKLNEAGLYITVVVPELT